MAAVYESITYNLKDFGIENPTSAIISCDKDSGIDLRVSFDGGLNFIEPILNKKMDINSNGKIKVQIIFNDEYSAKYRIPVSGNFSNLSIGTSLYFQDKETTEVFNTTIGLDGKYNILLPPGRYTVHYYDQFGNQTLLLTDFNSNIPITKKDPLIKENIVEMFFRDISWARYCIFDVFGDLKKMASGSAELNVNGDLTDKQTDRVCRWWAIGLL